MDYYFVCQCTRRIPVRAAWTGSEVRCACGLAVQVPPLSELHRNDAADSPGNGTLAEIRTMIAVGELPARPICTLSGRPTQDVLEVAVQCERRKTHHTILGIIVAGLVIMFLPIWWLKLLLILTTLMAVLHASREEAGRDIQIVVPLRVCAEFHSRFTHRSASAELATLLRSVPIYSRLLDEFPSATVRIHR